LSDQVSGELAHRLTSQFEAARAVQQPVEDGVCQGRLADVVVPVFGRQLAGDQGAYFGERDRRFRGT